MKRSLFSSKLESKSNNPSLPKVMRDEHEPAEKLTVPDSESESSEDSSGSEESESGSEESNGDDCSSSASKSLKTKNSEKENLDSNPKKTGSNPCQNKTGSEESSEDETSEDESGDGLSSSASEPPKDGSQAVALNNKETKILDLNLKKTLSESCQNKAGAGSASESHKDRSRALALKKTETNNIDLNPLKTVTEPYQNKAGSGAPSEPKKESPDLKHNVPVKRPLDEMSKENSQPKRLKLGSGREVATLMKTHAGFCYGLDEIGVSIIWDTEIDGEKRRELEEKLKRLKEIQFTLFLEQTQFVADATKVIVETLRNRK